MSIFDAIVSREPIAKGWSGDRKFKALTADGTAYFLRISPWQNFSSGSSSFPTCKRFMPSACP